MSILAIDTTCFGSWDVVSLAKKLTILEFGIFFRGTFIDCSSSDQYWWFFEFELVVLAYFCLEYYGITKVGLISKLARTQIFNLLFSREHLKFFFVLKMGLDNTYVLLNILEF